MQSRGVGCLIVSAAVNPIADKKGREIRNESQIHLTVYNRLRVVSNFGDGDRGAGEIHARARAREISTRRVASKCRARACVYFARPTIAIAKIRDYSQSSV